MIISIASLYDLDEESSELLRELEEEIILASLPPENVEQSALPRPTKSKIRKKRKHNAIASSSSQMEEGSSANSQEENRLSVNRGRTSGYIRSLHVLKKDIRRKYQEMYSNVINSHDAWLFTSFLKEFTNPNNIVLTITLPSQPNHPSLYCRGITEIVYGMTSIYLKLPDAVQLYEDIAIHVPHHGTGSRIISKMTFKGTRLFEIDDDNLAEEVYRITASSSSSSNSAVIVDDSDDNNSITSTEIEELNTSDRKNLHRINQAVNAADQLLIPAMSFRDLKRTLRPINRINSSDNIEAELMSKFEHLNLYRLHQPKDVVMDGHVTFQLNESHQIEGIHFQVQSVSQTIQTNSQTTI